MFLDKLANSLSGQYRDPPTGKTETSNVDEDLSEAEARSQGGKIFNLGELRHNNTSRLAEKKSFLSVEAINCSSTTTNEQFQLKRKIDGSSISSNIYKATCIINTHKPIII